jgi:hypothetical protein
MATPRALGLLFLLIVILVALRTVFPHQTSELFHIPDGLDPITATEWMLFRIVLLLSFVWALYELFKKKVAL